MQHNQQYQWWDVTRITATLSQMFLQRQADHQAPPPDLSYHIPASTLNPGQLSTGEMLLLVDFENIQQFDLQALPISCDLLIMLGANQKQIPSCLVLAAQQDRRRVTWQQADGSGPNALDFYIACQLGQVLATRSYQRCFVLSKDTGFDPLLNSLSRRGLPCKRVTSIAELLAVLVPDSVPQTNGTPVLSMDGINLPTAEISTPPQLNGVAIRPQPQTTTLPATTIPPAVLNGKPTPTQSAPIATIPAAMPPTNGVSQPVQAPARPPVKSAIPKPTNEQLLQAVTEALESKNPKSPPRSRKSLLKTLSSWCQDLSAENRNNAVNHLIQTGKIRETNKRLSYWFESTAH